jgi:hypothetical protein
MIKAHIAGGHEIIMHMPLRMTESNQNNSRNVFPHPIYHMLCIVMLTRNVIWCRMCPVFYFVMFGSALWSFTSMSFIITSCSFTSVML